MTTTKRVQPPPQVATLPEKDTQNALNRGNEKETIETRKLVAFDPDRNEIRTVVDARYYMARRSDGASPVYCSVWIETKDRQRWLSGRGIASGYGYHKQSAAFDAAVESAGITLARRVDGVGDSAVVDAMHAIAIACGYGNCVWGIV